MAKVKVKELLSAYEKAVKDNKSTFRLKGMDFFTPYAKYLLEYARMRGLRDNSFIELVPMQKKKLKRVV